MRLVQLVERCLSADPGARPTAASVAVDLYDAAVAEPVQLGDRSDPAASITHRIRASARAASPPEPPRRRRWLPFRWASRGPLRRPGTTGTMVHRSSAQVDPSSARGAAVPPPGPVVLARRPASRRARPSSSRGAPASSRSGPAPRIRPRRASSGKGLRSAGAGLLLVLLLAVVLGGVTGVWVHGHGGPAPGPLVVDRLGAPTRGRRPTSVASPGHPARAGATASAPRARAR